ncbi:uncharacterized protein BDV17DRAFT_250595 [Aspergillus undulatus]|uniref:uncharacterized protein n=1 Tax=Aspergillus undulatus TaxID=1810928 RepID=UPI003CCCC04D
MGGQYNTAMNGSAFSAFYQPGSEAIHSSGTYPQPSTAHPRVIPTALVTNFIEQISTHLGLEPRSSENHENNMLRIANLEAEVERMGSEITKLGTENRQLGPENNRLALENEHVRNRLEVLEEFFYKAVDDRTLLGRGIRTDIDTLTERLETLEAELEIKRKSTGDVEIMAPQEESAGGPEALSGQTASLPDAPGFRWSFM